MRIRASSFCLALALGFASVSAQAAPITFAFGSTTARVQDSTLTTDSFVTTIFPHSETLIATDGNSFSTVEVNWSGDETGLLFLFDITHSINNTDGGTDFAQVFGEIHFVVEDDFDFNTTPYEISANYNSTGPTGLVVHQSIKLEEENIGSDILFRDNATSTNTANVSFTAGTIGEGDSSNLDDGALTGFLNFDQQYGFHFNQFIQDIDYAGISGSATGQVCLAIGSASCPVAVVPEPSTLGLLGAGLLGLWFRRKTA